MKTKTSYIRYFIFSVIAVFLMAYTFSLKDPFLAFQNWLFWAVTIVVLVIGLAAEICVEALYSILFKSLSLKEQAKILAKEEQEKQAFEAKLRVAYQKLTKVKAIEEEHEIILDHNYDGIQELDNKLPPWWVWGFYCTILFAIVYLVRFHVFNDKNQFEEYNSEIAEAQIAIAEWKKTAKNLVDANSVTFLSEPEDLKKGKAIFDLRCVACHKANGEGGIGPNLTDEYWILGGGIKNVFNTISEGGRSGKGMVPWKTELKPVEIAQVASYVISLQGTKPENPKEPQGEIWKTEK